MVRNLTFAAWIARHPEARFFPVSLLRHTVSLVVGFSIPASTFDRWRKRGTAILRGTHQKDSGADSPRLRLRFAELYALLFERTISRRFLTIKCGTDYAPSCKAHINCYLAEERSTKGKKGKAKIIHVPLNMVKLNSKKGTLEYRGETGEHKVEGIVQRSLQKYALQFGESVSYVSENPRNPKVVSSFRGKHHSRFSWQDVRQDLALQMWYALLLNPAMQDKEAENLLMASARNRFIDYYRKTRGKNSVYLVSPSLLPVTLTASDTPGQWRLSEYAESDADYLTL